MRTLTIQGNSVVEELPRATAQAFENLEVVSQPQVVLVDPNVQNVLKSGVNAMQCGSEYMRTTTQRFPNSAQLISRYSLPLGAVVKPLNGQELPLVNFGTAGVIRCRKCRTYINPFVTFLEGGRRWQCNICRGVSDVPQEYFSPLDNNGLRRDIHDRLELQHGSVEIVAPSEYMVRPPQPPVYFFVIDVSSTAVGCGLPKVVASTILDMLDKLPGDSRTQVGILTFDSTVHFYNLKSTLRQPQVLVVGDLQDIALPLPGDMLVNLEESRDVITSLLERIASGNMYGNNPIAEVAAGAAIEAAGKIVSGIGGKILLFLSGLPTFGPGKLSTREDVRFYNTEKEATLLKPAVEYYKDIAVGFSKDQVGVDVFFAPTQYVDVATIGTLAKYTGGEMKFYPAFRSERDGERLQKDLSRNLSRETGWEAVLRIRTSSTMKITNYFGHFFVRGHDLLALPTVDADKTFAITMELEPNTIQTPTVSIQAALLYTTSSGERRIRVHTMSIPVTPTLSDLYKYTDINATMNVAARMAVDQIVSKDYNAAKNFLVKTCVNTLKGYRQHVVMNKTPQMLLPDALKLLPLYCNGLLKSTIFASTDVRADERCLAFADIMTGDITTTALYAHPVMIAVHSPQNSNDENSLIPLSQTSLAANGIYLLDDGQFLYLWFGSSVRSQIIDAVLQDKSELAEGNADVADRVRAAISQMREKHQKYLPLRMVKQNSPAEARFLKKMIEDRGINTLSYPEFVAHLHRQICESS